MAILRGFYPQISKFSESNNFEFTEETLVKLLELAYEDGWYGSFGNKTDNALQIVNTIKNIKSVFQEEIRNKYNKEKTDLYR